MVTRRGPSISLSQRIGDKAKAALNANKPDNWNMGESSGDDFGYDFQVIAFDPGGDGAQCAFNIQLKGTTQKTAKLSDGSALSYPFDRTTLNLWHRSGFAVLVVIVDLIETQDPKKATVHYHFANYDLEDILPTLPNDQKTVRLHVPTSQLVHMDLDILPVVLSYLDEAAEGRRAARDRRRASGAVAPDRVSIGTTAPAFSSPPSHVVVDDDIEVLIGASPNRAGLDAALAALRSGDFELVIELCPHPTEEVCKANPQDAAIAAHLRSMALDAVGDSEGADILTDLAVSLLPDYDGTVGAAAQKQLDAIEFGDEGRAARDKLIDSLKDRNGISVTSIKSKILALNGDFALAREVIMPFPPEKIATTQIVVSIMERAWDRVLTEVAAARKLTALRPKQRLWLDMFEARAHFEAAFRAVPRPEEGDFTIPSTGLPQVDYDGLRPAYDASRRAMLAAQRLNWPADIKYILDVFPVSAMLLGYTDEAMPLMAALGLARAAVTPIREVVAKMAVQLDHPEIALQLGEYAGSSPRFEHEVSVMAVAALKAGQLEMALGYVTDEFLADPSIKDVYLTSLLMLGMAAHSTLRTDLLEKIRARLDRDGDARHCRAILDSAVLVQQSLLRRPEAIQKLHTYWSENGRPTIVGYHLLTNTDPRNEDEAGLFVDVAENLEAENSLGAEALADYGQALLTINRVSDAVTKLSGAAARFQDDPKIQSLLGIALEIIGQSPKAFEIFERLLKEGKASETARRYFVEISARMGFFDQAEQQVRAAYAKATVRDRKLRLLNTLFQLLVAEGKRPGQVEEVAWEYGTLANQNDEREEGIFLQEYLLATLPQALQVKQERIEEFRKRLHAYTERFPKSKYLFRAEVPKGGPPEVMVAALQAAVGLSDAAIEAGDAAERKMDRGALEVPFSWRPRRFLRNISDVFMLWEIRKTAPLERAALHFRSGISGYDRQVPQKIGECEAVISLTSLLLIDELGLLELILKTFPRLVVARATLINLQEARSTFTSGWGREKASRILEQLQKVFSKIGHPPYAMEEAHPATPDWFSEEKRAMEQAGRVYFSDDIVETYLVCSIEGDVTPRPSISTVDFLMWADKSAGIVSPRQVADAIAHMTRLRVMSVNVEQRYFIAAIPDDLNEATSPAQVADILSKSLTFQSMLDGVWDHFKAFEDLLSHFAANMTYLLNETQANQEVLVALWLRWLGAVRFQTKPNVPPLKKLMGACLSVLADLKSDRIVVGRLWSSFWTALQRGLGSELRMAEDRVAIEGVAAILGALRAKKEHEADAMALYEKAALGLEPGTEREFWLSNEYVRSSAEAIKVEQAKQE